MKDFSHVAFNPQPEPPGDRFGIATTQPPPFNPGLTAGVGPARHMGLLLPAVQA